MKARPSRILLPSDVHRSVLGVNAVLNSTPSINVERLMLRSDGSGENVRQFRFHPPAVSTLSCSVSK